jgi:hypothetical protein
VAVSKTHYTSGKRGKAPYVSLTVSGGKVKTVNWWMKEDCGYTETDHGATHLNTPIKRDGSFNRSITWSYPGWLGGSSGGTHIWGRLKGNTATVTVDDYASGQSQSPCEGRHTFHARRGA